MYPASLRWYPCFVVKEEENNEAIFKVQPKEQRPNGGHPLGTVRTEAPSRKLAEKAAVACHKPKPSHPISRAARKSVREKSDKENF